MQLDRRQKFREILHLPIEEYRADQKQQGMIINICEKGLCYYIEKGSFLQHNEILELSFTVDCEVLPIRFAARVVHQQVLHDYLVVGVQFTRSQDQLSQVLENYYTRYDS